MELAVNRNSKSIGDSKSSSNNHLESIKPAPFATTQSPEIMMNKIRSAQENINLMSSVILDNQKGDTKMKLSPQELEKTKQMLQKDVMQYNKDIQLLSLLIGRPLNADDVAKLATTDLGKATSFERGFTKALGVTPSTTSKQQSSSTSQVPAFKSLSDDEVKFLKALQQIQTTKMLTMPTTPSTTTPIFTTRSKSQEAILAALLKEQGIGPGINGNNQIALEVLLSLFIDYLII